MDPIKRLTLKLLSGATLAVVATPFLSLLGRPAAREPVTPPTQPTLFVDTAAGNDLFDGRSSETPLLTFARLKSLHSPFRPGTVIGIRAGTSIRERLILRGENGSQEAPIWVIPYGNGERPTWSGPDIPKILVRKCQWLNLYRLAADGGDRGDFDGGIEHNGCEDCYTLECESSNMRGRNHGFVIRNCLRCTWDGCIANNNGIVTGNVRTQIGEGFWCEVIPKHKNSLQDDILLVNCIANENAEDGYHMSQSGAGMNITIRSCVGQFNHEDFADNKGCQNLVIEHCIMTDNEEKAIPIHGFSGNTTIRWNLIARNGRKEGFEAITIDGKTNGTFGKPAHQVAIYGNIIKDNFGKAITWRHDRDTLLIAHNTIENNCRKAGEAQIHHKSKGKDAATAIHNNIVFNGANEAKAYQDDNTNKKTAESNNILHSNGPAAVRIWRNFYSNENVQSGAYQDAEGDRFGVGTVSTVPVFQDSDKDDYRLVEGSVGRSSGKDGVIPVNQDIRGILFGSPPDMGAFSTAES